VAVVNLFRLQKYKQTSEKYEACFNIFYSECSRIFDVHIKDTKSFYNGLLWGGK